MKYSTGESLVVTIGGLVFRSDLSRRQSGELIGGGIMSKIRKFVRCPVCNELLALEIDTNIKTDRWPVKVEGNHGDHGYFVLLDSQFSVTEVKKKPKKAQ